MLGASTETSILQEDPSGQSRREFKETRDAEKILRGIHETLSRRRKCGGVTAGKRDVQYAFKESCGEGGEKGDGCLA